MDCSTPGFPVLHYFTLKFVSIESVMPSNYLSAKGQQGAIPQHGACRGCQMHACGQEQPSKTRACSLFLKASRGRETEAGVMKHGMKEKKSHTLEAKCTGHWDWWHAEQKEGALVIRWLIRQVHRQDHHLVFSGPPRTAGNSIWRESKAKDRALGPRAHGKD